MKKAFITGVNGQDGSYLSELLLEKGYTVTGMVRRSSTNNLWRIQHLLDRPNFALAYGDLLDSGSLRRLITAIKPDEIYNLAAQSHVKISFDIPEYTMSASGTSVVSILDILREYRESKEVKFYQAGSSEMFGSTPPPQTESSIFSPRSPYACAKVMAHNAVVNYRDAYGIFAVNGILFNHESPRRGEDFVTRKIVKGAIDIKQGRSRELVLGNLNAKRDWGYAKDYVEAMWMMLQKKEPRDYVICTGRSISVRDFLALVFTQLDMNYNDFVRIDRNLFRPSEVDYLEGDYSKARTELNWSPKTTIEELSQIMIKEEYLRLNS